MNKELITSWLNSTDLPLTVISRKLNISRNTLYAWRKGEGEIRYSNYVKFLEVFGNELDAQGESKMDIYNDNKKSDSDLGYVGLLKDKIQTLQKENATLSSIIESNPFSDAIYDNVNPDFKTSVELQYIDGALQRRIISKPIQVDKLTTKENEIYNEAISSNQWYAMNYHPINNYLTKSSLKEIQGYTKFLGPILNAMKIMVGGSISVPISYKLDKRIIHTHCYMKIYWWETPKRIETKNCITTIENYEEEERVA